MKELNKNKNLYSLIGKTASTTAMVLMMSQPLMAKEATTADIPEKIEINIQTSCPDIPGMKTDKKKISAFSHKLHAEKYLIGKNSFSTNPYNDEFTCAACHLGTKSAQDITGTDKCQRLTTAISASGGGKGYKKQMHGICVNCHKKMKKAKETTGPTSCKDCHNNGN